MLVINCRQVQSLGTLKTKQRVLHLFFSFEKKESLKYRPQRVRNQPLSFRNSFNNKPFEKVAVLLEINQAENCPVSNKESPQFKNKQIDVSLGALSKITSHKQAQRPIGT